MHNSELGNNSNLIRVTVTILSDSAAMVEWWWWDHQQLVVAAVVGNDTM